MKQSVMCLCISFLICGSINAQVSDPCAQVSNLLKQSIVECDSLKKELLQNQISLVSAKSELEKSENLVKQLETDTAELRFALSQEKKEKKDINFELQNTINNLKILRKDSVKLQKILSTPDYKNSKVLKDSIALLNDSISKLSTLCAKTKEYAKQKEEECKLLKQTIDKQKQSESQIVAYLDGLYASKSLDALYNTTNLEVLSSHQELYRLAGKRIPNVLTQLIVCKKAEELLNKKYDEFSIRNTINSLPKNTNSGKALSIRLNNYASVYSAANVLWNDIAQNVVQEPVENDAFPQVQAKNTIWKKTQKFIADHPHLATEYPYVFDELQKMLQEVWKNANNFNNIKNPFKQ